MELKVFNISRHVPLSTIRILFSILGDILFFDYYSSVSRRDGTFECVIVYRELSEAQLAAKLDGTEMGDRCLEVRLSQSVDRFDIGFSSEVGGKEQLSSRTLLVKSEDLSCDLDRISNDFSRIFRLIELERDLGAGLPPLSARFFLLEFSNLEAATEALKIENSNYSVAEAHKHMQSFTVGNKGNVFNNQTTSTANTEEVLIYGVPASKLLDPTTTRSYAKLEDKDLKTTRTSSSHRSRSRSPDRKYHDRDYERDHRGYRHERDRDLSHRNRRSRSRSAERRRR